MMKCCFAAAGAAGLDAFAVDRKTIVPRYSYDPLEWIFFASVVSLEIDG